MLTAERLKSLLSYCPDTGVFSWKANRRGGCKAGDVAGVVYPNGYRFIKLDQRRYSAHRLAWLYMTGHWPKDCVDHINRGRDDNRFCNLREATQAENHMNSSASGVKYYARQDRWKAYIGHKGRQIYLGMFSTREEARAVRRDAELKYHGEFAPA